MMKSDDPNVRMILKFDSGLKGFERMIGVLALTAVIVLALGIYFIIRIFPTLIP